MSIYEGWPRSPGATEEELKLIRFFKKADIIRGATIIEDADNAHDQNKKVTRAMVDKFISGEHIPTYFRKKIMQYVLEKSEEMENQKNKLKL